MDITYEFKAYSGATFKDENQNTVNYSSIKDNFYKINDRMGKIIYKGYTSVYTHGFSGGYDNYGFIFQDDLSSIELPEKVIFKAVL